MGSQKEDSRAIGWHDGTTLYGKKRWDIIVFPYTDPSDHLILYSNKTPAGVKVVTGADSAFKTVKRLYGYLPNKEILANGTGIEQLEISPGAKSGLSLHNTPLIPRLRAHLTDHKTLPTEKKGIDDSKAIFPLRRRM